MTRIEQFGWRGPVEPGIGRVVSAHGDYYHLVADEQPTGELLARKKKSAFTRMKAAAPLDMKAARIPKRQTPNPSTPQLLNPSTPALPITGDFVRFRHNAQGDSMITEVLPRFSHFERKDPTARRQVQTLAVNFDTLFIMMSLNENFSLPRLKRYLALAEDMGEAAAVVVLTKLDRIAAAGERERFIAAASGIARSSATVIAISSLSGEGLDALAPHLAPRRTVAFIGSSGVGKSTLLNTLAGEEWQATQEVQEWSGKGRHTTTSRELVMLPSGAMVIDTPGIREIGLVGESESFLVKGESTHRYRK